VKAEGDAPVGLLAERAGERQAIGADQQRPSARTVASRKLIAGAPMKLATKPLTGRS
jgi:hypothetical protein